MTNSPQNSCEDYFSDFRKNIKNLEKKTGGKVVFFDGELDYLQAIYLHKILRKIKAKKLFLILDSPGGQIDVATKIINLCKRLFDEVNIIVPFMAKSAATLICLSADNLFLGNFGEMGPVDPQVQHPVDKKRFFPALSIKSAIEFIEDSKDSYVKMGLTDKIDPYLMGAYKRILNLAEQYLQNAKLIKESNDPYKIIKALTKEYISHGYPIDIDECSKLGIRLSQFKDPEVMKDIYDIYENYVEFIIKFNMQADPLIISSDQIEIRTKRQKPIPEEMACEEKTSEHP